MTADEPRDAQQKRHHDNRIEAVKPEFEPRIAVPALAQFEANVSPLDNDTTRVRVSKSAAGASLPGYIFTQDSNEF